MNFIKKIVGIIGGDPVGKVTNFINTRWPPDMSEEQKANVSLSLKEFEAKQEEAKHKMMLETQKIGMEVDAEFNQRIKDLEGTASDLKGLPVIGRIVLFLRGTQRPLWGFGTIFADYMIFSGGWDLALTQSSMSGNISITPEGFVLIIMNFLVLGFLFGERALRNIVPVLLPLIEKVWGRGTKE